MKSYEKYKEINEFVGVFVYCNIDIYNLYDLSFGKFCCTRGRFIKCDPNPAQIGQYVNVWIKIENIGNTRAEDVSVELIPSYPFSLDAGDDALRNIGILSPDRHASLEYHLYVDENARPGTRSIKVRYQDDESTAWKEKILDIWVGAGSDTFDSSLVLFINIYLCIILLYINRLCIFGLYYQLEELDGSLMLEIFKGT